MKVSLTPGWGMRALRTIHGWLGALVLPWIIVIGATGFYLNHWKPILHFLTGPEYDETRFDSWPASAEITPATALKVAARFWPHEAPVFNSDYYYHQRRAILVQKPSGRIIVTKPTGHYFVETNWRRRTYAPDGELLESRIYWGDIFKRLHKAGWLANGLGTWLADITSLAMVVFGTSGFFLFWTPRLRRIARALKSSRPRTDGTDRAPSP